MCFEHWHGVGAVQKYAASEVTGPDAARQRTIQMIGLQGKDFASSEAGRTCNCCGGWSII